MIYDQAHETECASGYRQPRRRPTPQNAHWPVTKAPLAESQAKHAIRLRHGGTDAMARALDAETALRALADHHHHTDGPAAVGRRLRLHGAPLADRLRSACRQPSPRHRRDHRPDRDLSARPTTMPTSSGSRSERLALNISILPPIPCPRRVRSRSSRSSTRSLERRDHQTDQPPLLDRYGRRFRPGRDPHPARGQGAARLCPPQPGLCLEHPYFPRLDGRHLARAAR